MPAYNASKAGLIGLVRSLADELSPRGIRVNAVCPGWIDTPFNDPYWSFQEDPEAGRQALDASIPARRQGTPEDVAGVVLFLASPAARYVTGTSVIVDGGYSSVCPVARIRGSWILYTHRTRRKGRTRVALGSAEPRGAQAAMHGHPPRDHGRGRGRWERALRLELLARRDPGLFVLRVPARAS